MSLSEQSALRFTLSELVKPDEIDAFLAALHRTDVQSWATLTEAIVAPRRKVLNPLD